MKKAPKKESKDYITYEVRIDEDDYDDVFGTYLHFFIDFNNLVQPVTHTRRCYAKMTKDTSTGFGSESGQMCTDITN